MSTKTTRENVPVLALGAGITLLGTLRGLGRAGIRAFVASAVNGFVRRSRWCHALALPLIESADPVALAESLRRLPYQNAVLMACTDNWSAAVAGLDAETRRRFPASISGPEVQEILVDKARFARALRRWGVPHPRTTEVRSIHDLEVLPARDFTSAFLKPCASQSFSTKYGVKAFRCPDKQSTLARYRQVEGDGLALVLQEYVPGPPNCHYFIDGFVDRHGALLALFARRRLRMHPADFGNSTCMVSVPPGEVAPAVAPLRRLLRELRFRGIFSAEFKRDPRDGAFKLLEVNARPWWYIGFALACGVNVARLAYEDALGLPTAPVRDYRVGVRCVFPQLDWVACARLRQAGQLTWRECLRDWTFSAKPIFAWDDPMPAVRNAVSLAGVALKRLLPGHAAPAAAPAAPKTTVVASR